MKCKGCMWAKTYQKVNQKEVVRICQYKRKRIKASSEACNLYKPKEK